MSFAIIKNNRKMFEEKIYNFLKSNNINYINVKKVLNVELKLKLLEKNNVKILFFSNGTDNCDRIFINYLFSRQIYENNKLNYNLVNEIKLYLN